MPDRTFRLRNLQEKIGPEFNIEVAWDHVYGSFAEKVKTPSVLIRSEELIWWTFNISGHRDKLCYCPAWWILEHLLWWRIAFTSPPCILASVAFGLFLIAFDTPNSEIVSTVGLYGGRAKGI
jgi:hypothetical protein